MGMGESRVRFEGREPALDDICAAISDISGLSVVVLDSRTHGQRDWSAEIAFECEREARLEIVTHPRRTRRRQLLAGLPEDMPQKPETVPEGAGEPEHLQEVWLRSLVFEDSTLYDITRLALESLGGSPLHAVGDDERRDCGRNISESELRERHEKAKRKSRRFTWTMIAWLPVFIPVCIIGCAFYLVTLPYRLWRAYKRHGWFKHNRRVKTS